MPLRYKAVTSAHKKLTARQTADSMKSRGHGLKGRTSYSLYKFDKRDAFMLCTILFTGLVLMILLFIESAVSIAFSSDHVIIIERIFTAFLIL